MKPSNDTCGRLELRPVLLCAALLAGLACVSTDTIARAQEPGAGLTVTVMLYSGRPNPTFTLTDQAVLDRVRAAYREAGAIEGFERSTVIPSVLGYQGIRIENPRGEGGLPRVILVYRDNIEVRNGAVRFLSDPGRALENALVEEAAERDLLDEQALRMIRQNAAPEYPSGS